MWFNELDPNKNYEYVLSLSYGKDSMASIYVILEKLKWRLDQIVTADVWFDDETPADLPPVWDFKQKMDELILKRWGIKVEHLCAMRGGVQR